MRIVDWKDVPVQEILRGNDSHSTSACPIVLPPPKGRDTTVTPHLESLIKVGMEQLYPAPCTACGFLPNVSATETSEISNFFLSAKDLLPYLRRVGIIHDRHLRAILNWEEANRLEFIDALPSKLVPMMEKIRLRRLLVPRAQAPHQNNQYQNHRYEGSPATPRREREYEYAQIPRPSKEEEERLSSPRTPLDELRKAMTIQPENFESVTAAIDAVYEQYSDKLNDAGVTAWKEFYNALYAREPVLQLYRTTGSNNWAASIYIKHLLRPSHKTAAGPTSQTQTRENSRTSTMPCTPPRRPELVPSKLQRQMAGFGKGATTVLDIPTPGLLEQSASMPNPHRGITLTTCPIHYPPDPRIVSQNLQELLGSSGSDELLPAFVAVGIRTDEGVKELASLSKKDRVQLFKENQDLKFTELQTFMLKTMLHKL
ncbi:hypothetical protein AMATHDRAFT_83309 [Amanita thiersii Skay4041]|uniref:Uncharacterized protein n=1 Tax=Amanita thiersii Skay4041 TaxID=703135 RepID=A0A2A9NUH6_9AGAR|nr:hypothetical protein AMATHDRAFT_83309 [Amanita thiersii Skay4041]